MEVYRDNKQLRLVKTLVIIFKGLVLLHLDMELVAIHKAQTQLQLENHPEVFHKENMLSLLVKKLVTLDKGRMQLRLDIQLVI